MRRSLVAGISLLALAATVSPAAPFTAAFDDLRTALEFSRDNEFGGTLDRTLKRQQAAILKSLAALDKPADDLGDDLKTAGKVARALEKAFPQFAEPSDALVLLAGDPFPGAVDDALSSLNADVVAAIGDLAGRAGFLSEKGAAKVAAAVGAANAALAVETPTRFQRAKSLGKAFGQVVKGHKAADKDSRRGPPNFDGSVTVDGSPFEPNQVLCSLDQATGIFTLTFNRASNPPSSVMLTSSPGLPGSGIDHPLASGSFSEGLVLYIGTAGTMNLTTYDPAHGIFEGTFSFTANGIGFEGSVTVTGTFSVSGATVISPPPL